MEVIAIQLKRLQYKNTDSAEKLIRYITRTRKNEDRANELLLWGHSSGYTYPKTVEELIHEFETIQKHYHSLNSLMCHYSIRLRPTLFEKMDNNIYTLGDYAVECCNYLFNLGHQSVFAIHLSKEDGLHIHLAINSTNYRTGYKLRQYPKEIKKTVELPLLNLMNKYIYKPVSFSDVLEN